VAGRLNSKSEYKLCIYHCAGQLGRFPKADEPWTLLLMFINKIILVYLKKNLEAWSKLF